jgi:hypothetical protein
MLVKIRAAALRLFLACAILLTSFPFSLQNLPVAQAAAPLITNLAGGKTVTVDSGTNPASVTDGSKLTTNNWASAATSSPHWLEINLGATYNVSRVLIWTTTRISTTVYTIQTWNGSSWVNVSGLSASNATEATAQVFMGFNDFNSVATSRVRVNFTTGGQIKVNEVGVYEANPQPVFVNQSGYNLNKSKRFTAPNADSAATFAIRKVGQTSPVFSGNVVNQIGDFTSFNPSDTGEYVITVNGTAGEGQSVPFSIGHNWIERVSYGRAVDFMVDSRCWNGNSGSRGTTEAGCGTGVAWRDSHQFAFEIPTLLAQFYSNPSAYSRMPATATYNFAGADLPAGTPEIVRLIYWAVDVYITPRPGLTGDAGRVNHTLLKEQLAYFLYAYPDLQTWIPQSVYNQVRDYTFAYWGDTDKSRWNWYDVTHTANLFQTYTQIGSGKGAFPPGHSIVPNLMMYEVAKREGRSDFQSYFDAAYNNTEWLIANLDWSNPATTKGQRMSEHVTMEALAYFQKEYPTLAPPGLYAKIESWADTMISRSNNLWDFRKYSATTWIIPSFNEPGNVAGFPAAAFAAVSVLTDATRKTNLRRIAMSQIDHVFGRNPAGRHFSHEAGNANAGFEGVEFGWFGEYNGGAGALNSVRGVLDGSLKEASYPYNPNANPGYIEGWVNFNTAWNASLAYMAYDDTEVKAYNSGFTGEISSLTPGTTFGVQLKAPLNFNYSTVETGTIQISTSRGDKLTVTANETSANGTAFRATVTSASGAVNSSDNVLQLANGDTVTLSYGYGTFQRKDTLTVGTGATTLFSDNFEDGNATGWTVVNGSWGVVADGSQVYKQTAMSGEALAHAGNLSWTDYTVEAKIKLYDIQTQAGSGIVARYTDSNNFYMLRLHHTGKLQLYKKRAGTFTLLQEVNQTVATGTWYTLKLRLDGNTLTGYVGGVEKINFTDTNQPLTAGKIGLRCFVQTCAADDIVVTS